jgi:formylglycine-generating enzyme required for sulfatase activity
MSERWALAGLLFLGATVSPAGPPLAGLPFHARRAAELRRQWAKETGLAEVFTNSQDMKLVLIPGGRFDMGPNGSKRRVTITKPYYLGTTEVTLGQYRKFRPGHKIDKAADEFNADDRPAAMVSWDEAVAFCKWLSAQPREKEACRVYHLPTEAQWEWAARAGTTTASHFGEKEQDRMRYAWYNHTYTPNPKHEEKGRGRQPVGKLLPNAWGLVDMLGNVWEWCGDRRGDEETGEVRDPVMRGGSWRSGGFHCTSVAHDPGAATQKGDHIGFRVACRVVRLGKVK